MKKTIESKFGPMKVGGLYLCGYWGKKYTVLGFKNYADWRGESVKVRWEDGKVGEHSTAWDHRKDKVLAEPIQRG